MRKTLTLNLLIASLVFPACSDGAATVVTDRIGPEAPINEPDTGVFNPTGPVAGGEGSTTGGNTNGGETASGTSTGGTSEGTAAQEEQGTGAQGGGNSSGSGGEPLPGEEESAAGGGGQPVPEPGTLLLFGTGLAGIGASLLRRRRREDEETATA